MAEGDARKPLLWPLYASAFVGDGSTTMVGLALPIYAYSLGAGSLELGVIGGASGIVYCFAPALFGRLSDALGRRRLLSLAFLGSAAASSLYALSTSPVQLIAVRLLEGASLALLWPALEALVADRGGAEMEKALRGYNVSWSAAWIAGPLVGGALISALGARAPFYVAAALSAWAALLSLLGGGGEPRVRRLNDTMDPAPAAGRRLFNAYLSAFLLAFVARLLLALFPAHAVSIGIAPLEVGVILLSYGASRTVAFSLAPGLLRKAARGRLLPLVSLMTALSSIPLWLGFTKYSYYMGFAMLGVFAGLAYGASLSLALEARDSRGARAGLFESTIGLGAMTGPFAGGVAAQADPSAAYLVPLVAGLAVAALQGATYWEGAGGRRTSSRTCS